ncbi:hypothetical protein JTE90_020578 [Oedothorax gibbosus]|uniref:Uncharacterized protein n=1 Tax=Oedothorax gibbosus TaxID=931172 RepID=A0AAV6VW01_9ARAC|nr:hypothetical protein JTE90_020578 [Oedothorax gibbosus]
METQRVVLGEREAGQSEGRNVSVRDTNTPRESANPHHMLSPLAHTVPARSVHSTDTHRSTLALKGKGNEELRTLIAFI